ncbi:nuclease-related domain-containing protein [uncultured Lactobacillus sp.]|uniref:nuclease-related domain-containing protein n=1 Tax=uncultured Lactobacillus sp. TaxID=153152 RepID=UPI002804DB05|nr:nuclease-related domain-containing protein [uncultured Lactobacillus sp.]
MDITIITLTVGIITYCFFRSIKNKSKIKKVELSDTDKEELNKLEKIAGKQLPYRFPNKRGLTFQIVEFVRPGYIKRRIFDRNGHCLFLIKYNLDRTIAEFIEFGVTDGHYFRKTVWNENDEKSEFYQNGKRRIANFLQIKTKLQYYRSMVQEKKAEVMPLENDMKQYANELENHAYYQKEWVKRDKITDTESVHSIEKAEKLDFTKKRDIRRALQPRNVLRVSAINSGFKTYNKNVENFQKRMSDLHLGEIKHLHTMDVLSEHDLRHASNLLAGMAAEELVNKKIKEVQFGKVLIHNLILPYPYGKKTKLGNNQIDHLVIASSGIFCFETKARTSKNNSYDMLKDYSEIADQVAKHKESIKYVLEKSNNPVIINLLKRIPSIDQLIRNIVVVVSRNENDVKLDKTERYQRVGIEVCQLDDIQSILVKAQNNIGLQPEEISAIGEEMANNKALEEENTFSENVLLFEDDLNLDEKIVDEQLYHANQVIKHIEHINNLLADYLAGAREWRQLYQQYSYWKKFYNQVSNFADVETYHSKHQVDKEILDEI